jgi:hypothetical protein
MLWDYNMRLIYQRTEGSHVEFWTARYINQSMFLRVLEFYET